jgi:hypothetical protein
MLSKNDLQPGKLIRFIYDDCEVDIFVILKVKSHPDYSLVFIVQLLDIKYFIISDHNISLNSERWHPK